MMAVNQKLEDWQRFNHTLEMHLRSVECEKIHDICQAVYTTVTKLLYELDSVHGIGLIERYRQGNNRPSVIYVKNFVKRSRGKPVRYFASGMPETGNPDCKELEIRIARNWKSGTQKNRSPDCKNLDGSNTKINRMFGYTAQQTLDAVQEMYEQKLVTYPRTDSQYLTDEMGESTETLIQMLLGKMPYAKRDPKTEEPTKIAKIYVTVYYAEKGEQMLHHFKKSMDIGNGHGGIVSQLKYDNEMKLTDEYWINYQKGKGSEEFQKYMEDLTDMQNHVLPYLQSFCNLEEKGVKERREQQIAERYEGRADERVTSTEANEVVKDVGKTDRKPAQQKQAVDGKDKKLSIHERLEINKRIIQEKQGKDKTERGVDLGVRTV